ncbi:MAG: winged helix-turn-helix transcriptional regulator [Spirochaetales bacterium]|nr:winged helix-turn-helix transcriptional regulator [Spirochaetales bacterium]
MEDRQELINQIQSRFVVERCEQVEQLLMIMSNPVRFHILCAVSQGAFTVTELVSICGSKLSNVSQQLKIMTLSGFLEKERDGKQMYYKLKDQRVLKLIDYLETLYS